MPSENRRSRTCRVTFYPAQESAQVPAGATLREAAKAAGVELAGICGGDGLCGKCRVIVKDGAIRAAPTTLLSREEIQRGYVLACQTTVVDDVDVHVPPESRGEGAQILIDMDAQRFRALTPVAGERVTFEYAPLAEKLYLEMPPATLQDNLADHQRLFREIRRRRDIPVMQTGLKMLKAFPRLFRQHGWRVTATLAQRGRTVEVVQVEGGDTSGRNYGIAVDVGTSTIVAHLIDLNTSETLDAEAVYNAQRVHGEEVTRRILYAERGGLEELQGLVVRDINNLISALVSRNPVELHDVSCVIAAGNTTMIHLLLGLDPSPIRKNPYVCTSTQPPPIRAVEVGIQIHPRGLLYTVPGIGGWVGGDITAGVLATGLDQSDEVAMLIDIGTNGEIVLGNREWMIACSASAGPAFEGSGTSCGMKASRGAIERVRITPEGNVRFKVIGGGRPRGLCGSGLIDAVAELFLAGFISRTGRLQPGAGSERERVRVRERDGQREFVLVPAPRTEAGRDLVITQADITNLISAKAAIHAGARILAKSMGLDFSQLDRLYLAGGFGNYLDREHAILLGLIPDIPLERIRFVGNTSILGAKLALLSRQALERAQEIARGITYYDLISYPNYYEEFVSAKFLPHTELERFPSVAAKLKVKEGVG